MMENKIKVLRIEQGLSQEELAKEIKVSRQTINAIENDKYNPTLELAIKLSQRLNVSIEELFLIKSRKDET
ncbi:MAG: helix-turn-helix transcriptional regulator [Cellulosilyticaceae bacterium]